MEGVRTGALNRRPGLWSTGKRAVWPGIHANIFPDLEEYPKLPSLRHSRVY